MYRSLLQIALLLSVGAGALGQTAPPEAYRPVYHYTAPKNWVNDPNGLLFDGRQYHLFYQHNPFGNEWGHMSWGHAVSADLLHWQDKPLAIPEFTHPDGKTQTAIFSGSAVIDKGNRQGFCPTGTRDCLVALYTGNVTRGDTQLAQYQNLAYSADNGLTWQQYAHNPVLDLNSKEFRDPNVFWYAPQQKWVMATVKATEHRVALFESTNLKDWRLLSHFGPLTDTSRVWECPALMNVPIDGEPGRSKWVLFVSAGHPQPGYLGMQYFVGDFDGRDFRLDPANPKPLAPAVMNVVDWGKDYYAAIPVNNRPAAQPNPITIGWVNDWEYANKIPTTPFKGTFALPRTLTLSRTAAGLELVQRPISLAPLRGKPVTLTSRPVTGTLAVPFRGEAYELTVDMGVGSASQVGLDLLVSGDEATRLRYDVTTQTLSLDRTHSGQVTFSDRFPSVETMPVPLTNSRLKLHVLVDKAVIEVFADDGRRVLTDAVFPTKHDGQLVLVATGGTATCHTLTVWPIGTTQTARR